MLRQIQNHECVYMWDKFTSVLAHNTRNLVELKTQLWFIMSAVFAAEVVFHVVYTMCLGRIRTESSLWSRVPCSHLGIIHSANVSTYATSRKCTYIFQPPHKINAAQWIKRSHRVYVLRKSVPTLSDNDRINGPIATPKYRSKHIRFIAIFYYFFGHLDPWVSIAVTLLWYKLQGYYRYLRAYKLIID